VIECFNSETNFFGAVIATDGGGSPRCGAFANFSDVAIQEARLVEQRKAAEIGKYSALWQLQMPSRYI
jgi:hypothetical protein